LLNDTVIENSQQNGFFKVARCMKQTKKLNSGSKSPRMYTGKNKLRPQSNAVIQKANSTFNPRRLVGDRLSTSSQANTMYRGNKM